MEEDKLSPTQVWRQVLFALRKRWVTSDHTNISKTPRHSRCKKDTFSCLSISQMEEIQCVKGMHSIASGWRPCWNQIFFHMWCISRVLKLSPLEKHRTHLFRFHTLYVQKKLFPLPTGWVFLGTYDNSLGKTTDLWWSGGYQSLPRWHLDSGNKQRLLETLDWATSAGWKLKTTSIACKQQMCKSRWQGVMSWMIMVRLWPSQTQLLNRHKDVSEILNHAGKCRFWLTTWSNNSIL